MDEAEWRVVIDFGDPRAVPVAADIDRARQLEVELAPALTNAVSRELDRVFLYAPAAADADAVAEQVASRHWVGENPARITLTRWDPISNEWLAQDGTPMPRRRTVFIDRPGSVVRTIDPDGTWHVHRRKPRPVRRAVLMAIALVVTLAGIVWCAVAPGVTAYQFASVLMLPGLAALLVFVGMKLSAAARWTAAVALALLGLVGWLLIGGPGWWYWGKLAVWPLVIQLYAHFGPASREERWYGGYRDGAWGPP